MTWNERRCPEATWAQEIRTRRHRLCWSQKELARRLELAADDRLRSQLPSRASIIREIRFHESGTHRPGPVYAELYRRVWTAAVPELDGYPGILRPSRSTDHSQTGAEELAWIVAQARALTASNVDDYVLDIVERSIEQIINGYENDGPWPLVEQSLGLRHALHGFLKGRQSPQQRRELFRLAGGVAGLLGYMSVNLGRPLLCDAYCTEVSFPRSAARRGEMGQVDQGKEDHVPSPHPPEFRRRAVELARTGDKSISALTKSLGISQSCLSNWVRVGPSL
ncbi:hypothetical protein [Actinocorallia aurantiaca]|uniref:Uncharacterized protein n=1 Tax=Actinocorallia aurantiaca TaxID=46204 RepID=A0ABN3USL4_9ACTN